MESEARGAIVKVTLRRTAEHQEAVDVAANNYALLVAERAKTARLVEFVGVIAQSTTDRNATKQWMEDHAKILLHDLGEA